MSGTPTLLHADMDAFYAAVEQRDRPELKGKPVIVGGTGNRGVVSTCSYEARKFGVHSAMPMLQARQLCPQGVFLPGRMQHYVAIGKQVRRVFEEFTPLVEPLSLDEAFLDISGSLTLFGGAHALAVRLRQRVREETNLVVSVGIGPTKMVAKIASGKCKPDGLLEVAPDQVQSFLRPLPVGQIWGAGPATCTALERLGIRTVGALADADPGMLERRLGPSALGLQELARGRDTRQVEPDREQVSYGEEQTFDRDQRDGAAIRETISAQAEAVARRLRQDGARCRTVQLKFKLAQRTAPGVYPLFTRRVTLPEAVDDGREIRRAALDLWSANHEGRLVRLVGVSVSGLVTQAAPQLSLFEEPKRARTTALNRAVDELTARFGKDVVRPGDTLAHREQRARSLGKGPRT